MSVLPKDPAMLFAAPQPDNAVQIWIIAGASSACSSS